VKYFKNTELAKLYHVSEKSVRNWIDASLQGKNTLQLYEHGGKKYIANTSKNTILVAELAEKGKKYKNSRGFKVITPTDHFYEVYSNKQILDIVSSLTIHRELPLQYTYVDGGADYWDQYAQRLLTDQTPNMLTRTIQLIDLSIQNLERLIEPNRKVNVIDLGPGNGLPIRKLLSHLISKGLLGRYIAIDISKEMLGVAERNIKSWFGDIPFEGYVRDIRYERFDDLLINNPAEDSCEIKNLVLFFGGTLSNFRAPDQCLQAINNSLGLDDLLMYCTRLDTPNSRRHFDFASGGEKTVLDSHDKFLPDLLNIEESLYDVEQIFDLEKRARFIEIRMKIALELRFNLPNGSRSVSLDKDTSILLFRYWHQNALSVISQFDRNDFNLMHATKSEDQEYLLLLSQIRPTD